MEMIIATVIVLAVVGLLVGLLLVSADEAFAVEVDPKEIAVRACLPGNNCGACGQAGCDAMAAAIVQGRASMAGCPVGGTKTAAAIADVLGIAPEDPGDRKVAFVKCAGTCDKVKLHSNYVGIESCEAVAGMAGKGIKSCQHGCLGYGSCVKVCQFDAIHVVDGVARVDRSKCVGCGHCVAACPQNIVELVPDKSKFAVQCSTREKGPVVRKQCDVGCLGCGLCVRVCQHDAIHVEGNLARIDYSKCVGCGDCAAKCPAKIIRMR